MTRLPLLALAACSRSAPEPRVGREERKALAGRETITFVNRTRRPFDDVVLHLYLNGFRNTRSTSWGNWDRPSI